MIGIRNIIVKNAVEESEGDERTSASLAEKVYREALGRELSALSRHQRNCKLLR